MSRALPVRRTLAASAAFVIAVWGATAMPAAAYPGQGNGNDGNGNGHSQSESHKDDKKDKDDEDKSPQGPKDDKSPQGPKDDKSPQGPKDDKSPQGPKDDKGNGGGNGGGNGDPAGNNGTVKITPIGQDDGIPQNNPHVPCGFDIEWYGFDEGPDIISTVTLAMHAPTKDVVLTPGGPSEVFVGGDPATGAGTDTGFDGEATYYPTFDGEPHAQQGFHIKLTINTPGSQGADTKHKVFWVEPCETATEEVPAEDDTEVEGEQETDEDDASSTDAGTTDDTEVLGEQASAGNDTEVLGEQASAGNDTEVLGVQTNAAVNVPNAVAAGEEGDSVLDFARSPISLLILGLGALVAGVAFAASRRGTTA